MRYPRYWCRIKSKKEEAPTASANDTRRFLRVPQAISSLEGILKYSCSLPMRLSIRDLQRKMEITDVLTIQEFATHCYTLRQWHSGKGLLFFVHVRFNCSRTHCSNLFLVVTTSSFFFKQIMSTGSTHAAKQQKGFESNH